MGNFFDNFPEFYQTSSVGSSANRLNSRYRVLIEENNALIRDKSVLDLASHDGRWSFAAYQAGARHVCGIEIRDRLVRTAREILKHYKVTEERIGFLQGDVHQVLAGMEPEKFDTVLCLGFFYHTMNHMQLLTEMVRLGIRWLILDTAVVSSSRPIIRLREERTDKEANAMVTGKKHALVGTPSRGALDQMLSYCGFSASYHNWQDGRQTSWEDLEDYQEGLRVTLVANR